MHSYQNLIILKTLYAYKQMGFNYLNSISFNANTKNSFLPNDLTVLEKMVKECKLCDLCKSRKNALFSHGSSGSSIMLIIDEPNLSEDEVGSFYNGRHGLELKSMLKEARLDMKELYITSLVKCKTPNLRPIYESEIVSCSIYLLKQIELINPSVIVTLGGLAYKSLTKDGSSMQSVKGHLVEFNKRKLMPIFHPSHIIKNPSLRDETIKDLKALKKWI